MAHEHQKAARSWLWTIGLIAAVSLGALFRLGWARDIEYKADEALMFEWSRAVGSGASWPWLGMQSGVGLRNPGMSVWIFAILGRLTGNGDPPALARGVEVLAVLATLLVVAFALLGVGEGEREPWLWAAVLAAVNPIAVLYDRKIWAQSILPIFSVILLLGWWHRRRLWGALVWGAVGACLGQIHMSGFFFAGGLVLWALLFDRKGVCWSGWLTGSLLGVLPMVPWLLYVFRALAEHPGAGGLRFAGLDFWGYWIKNALGLSLAHSLNRDFLDFLRYPLAGGRSTFVVLGLHLLIALAGAVVIARACVVLWRQKARWLSLWIGRTSQTAFAQNAVFWGFGILLTASFVPIYPHYLIVAFPLPFLWLARMALGGPGAAPDSGQSGRQRSGRAVLIALCLAEALLTAGFLCYIHQNRGAVHGDFGVTYGAQLDSGRLPSGGGDQLIQP
jgi:hypothetical protein